MFIAGVIVGSIVGVVATLIIVALCGIASKWTRAEEAEEARREMAHEGIR